LLKIPAFLKYAFSTYVQSNWFKDILRTLFCSYYKIGGYGDEREGFFEEEVYPAIVSEIITKFSVGTSSMNEDNGYADPNELFQFIMESIYFGVDDDMTALSEIFGYCDMSTEDRCLDCRHVSSLKFTSNTLATCPELIKPTVKQTTCPLLFRTFFIGISNPNYYRDCSHCTKVICGKDWKCEQCQKKKNIEKEGYHKQHKLYRGTAK
jgi:hypothetical protein